RLRGSSPLTQSATFPASGPSNPAFYHHPGNTGVVTCGRENRFPAPGLVSKALPELADRDFHQPAAAGRKTKLATSGVDREGQTGLGWRVVECGGGCSSYWVSESKNTEK